MAKNRRTRQAVTKIASIGEIYVLATQLDTELQYFLHGSPTERDELLATAEPHLSYLKPMIDALTYRVDLQAPELEIAHMTLGAQDPPLPATTQPAQAAMRLAQTLLPYLTASKRT